MDPPERDQLREHLELVQDLLPSPPNEPSTSSSTSSGNAAAAASTRNRVVTVNDLKHRNCWICAEGDDDEEEQDTSNPSTTDTNPTNSNRRSSKKKKRSKRLRNFVHPCVCTLIAHESCLLTWIHQKSTPTNPIVSCPQCSSPFLLRSPKPWTLKSFEWMDKNWNSKILPRLFIGGGVGLIWSGLCWYGKWAVRAWMGGKGSKDVLARSWSKRWFFELGFVPLGLLSLRIPGTERIPMVFVPIYLFEYTGLFHTYLFYVLGYIFGTNPVDGTGREIKNYWEPVQVQGEEMMKWPPAPEVTLFLIPFVRSLYRVLRLRVTRYVLKPFIKKPPRSVTPRRPTPQANGQGQQGAAAAAPPRRLRRRIVIIGGEENQLVDADAEIDGPLPVGVEGIVDGNPEGINPNNDDDNSDDEDEIAGHRVEEHEALAEGDRPPQHRQRIDQTIYVSPQSLMRIAISALSLPFISAVTGEVAEWIVTTKTMKYGNNWLARFLNVTPASGREMRSSWWSWMTNRLGSTTTTTSSPPTFSDSLGWLKTKDRNGVASTDSFSSPRYTPTTLSTIYPRSDHWRNTISLCIYLVCSDTLSLAYRYLRLKQRTKTRVVDRPFRGKELLEGLELK